MSLNIKKGDNVVVIAGKDKGKTGKILEISPKDSKVLVENVNIVTKHRKPRSQQDKGGIVKKAAPIDASNVQIVCSNCGKATRVAHTEVEGKKVRSCKKCGASLDKEFVKAVKKEAKKASKTAENAEKPVKEAKTAAKKETAKAPLKTKKSTTETAENN